MHHIYHTEGLILGSRNIGETGKYYSVFTKDLGMIHARAQGVRKISSKLRFVLQDFSYLNIDLVKGKDYWRITSTSKKKGLEKMQLPGAFEIFAKISKLLKRLLAGEEPNKELFQEVVQGLVMLGNAQSREELEGIEVIIVLRILFRLGYVGNEKFENFILSPLGKSLILEVRESRAVILHEINKALKATHL